MAVATKAELTAAMLDAFGGEVATEATDDLSRSFPAQSARDGIPLRQAVWLVLILAALIGAFWLAPHASYVVASLISGAYFLAIMAFRLVLMAASFGIGERRPKTFAAVAIEPEARPPIYTLLVPLRDEAELLPYAVEALKRLDYPPHLLDILLILEADDERTCAAACELALDDRFTRLVVPSGLPRTKPKACNFALAFARGSYVCVFDAEDRPATDELALALSAFAAHEDASCLQASLTFYNVSENWLTRQFAIEFSTWFDFMLPGLERLGLPIPLGGSSNHFRHEALESIHGWDAFNMTEDADAGIRLARAGMRTRTLRSTTEEEANCELMNWLHQRSRWVKGYLMTYLVHMRAPGALWRELGPSGFISFQLLIGGAVFSALLQLVFWGMLIIHLGRAGLVGVGLWPRFLISWTVAVLIAGNGVAIATGLIALSRPQFKGQGRLVLALNALSMPLYWLLMSIAAVKALVSLIGRPFYWAKTRHGISRLEQRAKAQSRHKRRDDASQSRSRQA
jgi:cellulose synthase/poly-beta-1,6-N-acetylglucosamine synthase-like glycosyltransferase